MLRPCYWTLVIGHVSHTHPRAAGLAARTGPDARAAVMCFRTTANVIMPAYRRLAAAIANVSSRALISVAGRFGTFKVNDTTF